MFLAKLIRNLLMLQECKIDNKIGTLQTEFNGIENKELHI